MKASSRGIALSACLAVTALSLSATSAQALEPVTLQLKWTHAFQFAGYYAAKERGYYREAGLDVRIEEALPGVDPVEKVLEGKAEFGVGTSSLLLQRKAGRPVVALAVIFQHSPYVLIARQLSATQGIHDLIGKRVMLEPQSEELLAYLAAEGIPLDRITRVEHSYDPQDLIDGKVDAIAGYVTNQPYYLDRAHVPYQIYTPRSAGIDFYGDNLFTSERMLESHPERVKAFRAASLHGWKYAVEHPEEIVDLVLADYSQRHTRDYYLFEARQTIPLIQPDIVEIGYMLPGRWRHIADTYAGLGMLPRDSSLDGFLFDPDPRPDLTWVYRGLGLALLLIVIFVAVALVTHRNNRRLERTIVERRRMEAALIEARVEAERANRAKSEFLANMSHELRTPLNAILGFSRLMRGDADLSEKQREVLDTINRSGEHLLKLINDVLDMAKIEAGGSRLEETVFDLGEMARDVVDLLRAPAEAKGLALLLERSPEVPRFARADSAKLCQVLTNLVGNAITNTPHGSVTVRLAAGPTATGPGRLLTLSVEDTGVGIAAGDQSRIFEPFVQAGQRAGRKGTGLGLAIVRQYVELMGGRIVVESTPGKGSAFRVEVPVGLAEEADLAAADRDRARVIGLAAGQPDYRILIVEDERENRLLLERMLEGIGFQVRVAEDGAAGVEMFRQWRPHFVWMDCRMPVMDGPEATRRIRTLEGGEQVRIAALTASIFDEQRVEVMAAGMDDFVRKPFQPEEIYGCLARHLGVRFVHDEARAARPAPPGMALTAETLGTLPQGLRAELTEALRSLDGTRIGEAVRHVCEVDPDLGGVLEHHTSRLAYSTILQALRADGIGPNKETP